MKRGTVRGIAILAIAALAAAGVLWQRRRDDAPRTVVLELPLSDLVSASRATPYSVERADVSFMIHEVYCGPCRAVDEQENAVSWSVPVDVPENWLEGLMEVRIRGYYFIEDPALYLEGGLGEADADLRLLDARRRRIEDSVSRGGGAGESGALREDESWIGTSGSFQNYVAITPETLAQASCAELRFVLAPGGSAVVFRSEEDAQPAPSIRIVLRIALLE